VKTLLNKYFLTILLIVTLFSSLVFNYFLYSTLNSKFEEMSKYPEIIQPNASNENKINKEEILITKGDGKMGPVGTSGIQGVQGLTGVKGDRGEKGDDGDDGKDGENGEVGPSGPAGTLSLSYGSFFDTSFQSNPVRNVVRTVRYNTTAEADGISIVDGTKIKVSKAGVYNFQFSFQIYKTDGGSDAMDFWFVKNGNNLDDTNTRMTLINTGYYSVAAWNFVTSANAGDEFEIRWSSADTAASLYTSGPFTSPTRPRIPAVILTVVQIK
jgi:hypothetical protein